MNAKKIAEKLRRLAKYEIPSQPFTSRELKGIITDIADELDPPEPKPEPAFKVGDWVEIDGKQYRLSGVPLCGCAYPHNQKWYVLDINGNEFTHYTSENIRKLDPSEVRIKVTLEGTVSPGLNNPEEGFYLSLSKDSYAYVRYEMLDPDTAALVRELLAAQEEK